MNFLEKKEADDLRRRIFVLCLAIYRVTNLFPKEEVLINQTRQMANQTAIQLFSGNFSRAINDLEGLFVCFRIAEAQNWINRVNFEILKQEGAALKKDLLKHSVWKSDGSKEIKKEKIKSPQKPAELNLRQRQILSILKIGDKMKKTGLVEKLAPISQKTIQRDLKDLCDKDLINKIGNTRDCLYRLRV